MFSLLRRRENTKRVLAIAAMIIVVFSMFSVFTQVKAQGASSLSASSNQSSPETYPLSNFTDFQNGTTLTVVNYGNGTLDETFETLVNKTATLDFLNDESNQSISLFTSEQNHTSYLNSTQTATMQQQMLMGFTYVLAKFRYDITANVLTAYAQIGVNVDIEYGLRLPINITIEYPEQMTVGRNYTFYATITPIDKPNFNEFLCVFKAYVWVSAGVWAPLWYDWGHWDRYYAQWGPDYDLSKSFQTPLGNNLAFPIPPIYGLKIFDTAWVDSLPSFLKVLLGFQPGFGSDKVTAVARATGDGSVVEGSAITWTTAGQRIPFTILANNSDLTTDYAKISISDFRYYFTKFQVRFWLKFDFSSWIDWLTGDPEIPIYTWDLSDIIRNTGWYIGTHSGYPSSVKVNLFVKNYGVRIIQITPSVACIEATESALFEVSIMNTGSVNDTFELALQGVPSDWQYSFSGNDLNVTPGNMTKSRFSIKPPGSVSQGHFSYNVSVFSMIAPLDGLVATDLKSFAIDVSPLPPPQIQVLIPQNTTYATNTIALTFTINKPSVWIGYCLDNSGNITVLGNTTLTGLLDGSHNVVVFANDSLGDMGSSDLVYFSVRIPLHDVAVIDVVSSAAQVFQGTVVSVNVTVENNGTEPETFAVRSYYDTAAIGTVSNVFLNPADTQILTFAWDTSTVTPGVYTLKGEADQVPNEVNAANNVKVDGTVSIQTSQPQAEEKFCVTVNVTDKKGNPISNAAVYTNQESKLTDGGFVVFTFAKGNYAISAYKQNYQSGSVNVYVDQNMTLLIVLSPISLPSPVGGYSVSMKEFGTTTTPTSFYLTMVIMLSALFTAIRRKARKK